MMSINYINAEIFENYIIIKLEYVLSNYIQDFITPSLGNR